MKRIFSEIEPVPGTEFKITGEDAAHISRSLRAKRGERIVISSQGYEYVCEITGLSRDSVTLFVGEGSPSMQEPEINIILFMGYPKGDKLESVIQKSTELGVKAVVPFVADRSVARPSSHSAQQRWDRWQRIAKEAAKQSGRGEIPQIHPLKSYEEAIRLGMDADFRLFCYECGGTPLSELCSRQIRQKQGYLGVYRPRGRFFAERS